MNKYISPRALEREKIITKENNKFDIDIIMSIKIYNRYHRFRSNDNCALATVRTDRTRLGHNRAGSIVCSSLGHHWCIIRQWRRNNRKRLERRRSIVAETRRRTGRCVQAIFNAWRSSLLNTPACYRSRWAIVVLVFWKCSRWNLRMVNDNEMLWVRQGYIFAKFIWCVCVWVYALRCKMSFCIFTGDA